VRLQLVGVEPLQLLTMAGKVRLGWVVAPLLLLGACTGQTPTTAVDRPSPTASPIATPEPPEVEEPDTVTVPDVEGLKLARARSTLRGVGLSVTRTRKVSDEKPGTVISQRPVAGLEVRPGRTVSLVVAKPAPAPPPPPPPADNCHDSYEGACLDPNSPDYDCAGGSGDGPDYTGYVTVVGPDEYGLDGDGDGQGCE
jgi:resuscitation-promoting factor RpfB